MIVRAVNPVVWFLVSILLMQGCVQPKPVSTPAVVTFKSPRFKIHDTAFVITRGRDVTIEVYTAGTLVFEIEAGSMVCINGGCMSDDQFIAEYLSPYYPQRILASVARKEKLAFEGIETTMKPDGFMQRVQTPGMYDITYIVRKNEVFFRDRLNNIIIAIKILE